MFWLLFVSISAQPFPAAFDFYRSRRSDLAQFALCLRIIWFCLSICSEINTIPMLQSGRPRDGCTRLNMLRKLLIRSVKFPHVRTVSSITRFAPLFSQGTACLGLRSKTHVVLAALKRSPNELAANQKKIHKIDDHMGIAMSGLTADGRSLVK